MRRVRDALKACSVCLVQQHSTASEVSDAFCEVEPWSKPEELQEALAWQYPCTATFADPSRARTQGPTWCSFSD